MSAVSNAIVFLVSFLFDLFIFVLIARLLFQKLGANPGNSLVQSVVKLTAPLLKPLRSFAGCVKGFDLSIIFLVIVLAWVEMLLLSFFSYGRVPGVAAGLLASLGVVGLKFVNFYFYAVIIQVVVSWVESLQQSPAAELVYLVTAPLMLRAQRMVPLLGGVDLSPLLVLVALKLVSLLVFNPLIAFAGQWAFL